MNFDIFDIHGVGHTIDFDNFQSTFINCDCLQAMKKMPDKCVDLAITDPPVWSRIYGRWRLQGMVQQIPSEGSKCRKPLWN